MLPRLFQPFAQAETTLDRRTGGLGLGLALVRSLADLHGGAARAETGGPGKGSTFTVTLPLAAWAQPRVPERRPDDERAPRRVLVIEDNLDMAESLRIAIEIGNHVVDVAHSGPEGIERARAFKPDIVFCDIGLPEMDGYAVARAFRVDADLARVSLVALSGYARPEDAAQAKAAGFDGHLSKPVDVEALLKLVETGPPSNQ
jgi:two-component system CheB/CheR fusion protein